MKFRIFLLPIFLVFVQCVSPPIHYDAPDEPGVEEKEKPPELIVHRLSNRQKIGQHFIGWIPRDGADRPIYELLAKGEIGGFILYPWNYEDAEDARSLTESLEFQNRKNGLGIKLFFAADQEGGRVAAFRFKNHISMPSAYAMAQFRNARYMEAAGFITGIQLRSLGTNMNLAPVLDLYHKPDSTIIGDRSFGSDAESVTRLGLAYISGLAEASVIAVAKHFPGHGITAVDSHGKLPVIDDLTIQDIKEDLKPFAAAVGNGIDAIMTAHILLPRIDPLYPATLSSFFVDTLLRKQMGYEGIVISDGLAMGALAQTYSVDEALMRCFQVGVDIILVHSKYDISDLINRTEELLRTGKIDENKLDTSLQRILRVKQKYGLLFPSP